MRHSKAQNASYSRGTIWIKRGRSRKTPPQPWLGREDIQYCVTAHWYYKSLLHKNMDLTAKCADSRKICYICTFEVMKCEDSRKICYICTLEVMKCEDKPKITAICTPAPFKCEDRTKIFAI